MVADMLNIYTMIILTNLQAKVTCKPKVPQVHMYKCKYCMYYTRECGMHGGDIKIEVKGKYKSSRRYTCVVEKILTLQKLEPTTTHYQY